MASKRRCVSPGEGPQLKRDRRSNDDVIVSYKALEFEENNDDVVEIFNKIEDELRCDEDEIPVICEVPVEELDDVDPLRPLDDEGDVMSEEDVTVRPWVSYEPDILQDQCDEKKSHLNTQRSSTLANQVPAVGYTVKSEIELPKSSLDSSRESPSTANAESSNLFIQLLVETNFLMKDRVAVQENNVIRTGRPTPSLKSELPWKGKMFWAGQKEYQEIPWLTGYKKHHYCWPCLLFTRERWNLVAGTSEDEFLKSVRSHEETRVHKLASKYLKLREAELGLKELKIAETPQKHIVKMNRNLLALLIRILCSKKAKLQNVDSDYDGYEELMKVAISYDEEMKGLLGSMPNDNGLIDFVSQHAEQVLMSIKDKISARILEEISKTQFIAVIYEDTESVVDRKTKIAVIVRYMTDTGELRERFVKFLNIGSCRNAHDIIKIHHSVIEELGIQKKLVGITFSGTVIAPDSIKEFNHLVNKASPKANFFNHPDHNLKEILLQSLSHVEEFRQFFEVLSELVKFLTNNSGAIPTLITFIKHYDQNCKLTAEGNYFTIGIISTIKQYYSEILQFFFKVSTKFWNDELAKHAPIFMKFLQDPFNRFSIVIIANVLDTVEDLSQLMEKEFTLMVCKNEAAKVVQKLRTIQLSCSKNFDQLASKSKAEEEDKNKFYSETFSKIFETAIKCVLYRVQNPHIFSHKLLCQNVSDFLQAPEIWGIFGKKFDTVKDFKDLMSFVPLNKSLFKDKSMADIVKTVCKMKLSKNFTDWPKFIRFCALAVLPVKSTPPTVLRLKSYLKDKKTFNSTDTMMFLETDSLRSLVKTPEFIDEVINHYAKKNNKHNFLDS